MSTEAKRAGGGPKVRPAFADHLCVCGVLGINPDTWRKRVKAGTAPLPHYHMGNRSYYRRADLRYFIKHGRWPEGMKFNSRSVPRDQTVP
jgi:hypothetical protein